MILNDKTQMSSRRRINRTVSSVAAVRLEWRRLSKTAFVSWNDNRSPKHRTDFTLASYFNPVLSSPLRLDLTRWVKIDMGGAELWPSAARDPAVGSRGDSGKLRV